MAKTHHNRVKKGVRKTHRNRRTVKRGAGLFNVSTRNVSRVAPHEVEGLYQAIQRGDVGLADKLLRKNGVNPNVQKQNFPFTPLELAIKLQKNNIAMILLEKKANPAGAIEMALISNNKEMTDNLRKKGLFPNPEIMQKVLQKDRLFMPQGTMPGQMPGQSMTGQMMPGQMPGQQMMARPPMMGQMPGQMTPGQMMPGQPMMGQSMMQGQMMPGQPMMGQMPGQMMPGQMMPGQMPGRPY